MIFMAVDNLVDEEYLKEVEEDARRRVECAARGHPYPEASALCNYNTGDALVTCSNCGGLYERPLTGKELKEYSEAFRIEFNI